MEVDQAVRRLIAQASTAVVGATEIWAIEAEQDLGLTVVTTG
jgi:hypothetical protein